MKDLIVIIDRVEGSNIHQAVEDIKEVLAVLEPLRDRGLRIRITRATSTLVEDKVWQR
jgi:hypothetical protein